MTDWLKDIVMFERSKFVVLFTKISSATLPLIGVESVRFSGVTVPFSIFSLPASMENETPLTAEFVHDAEAIYSWVVPPTTKLIMSK